MMKRPEVQQLLQDLSSRLLERRLDQVVSDAEVKEMTMQLSQVLAQGRERDVALRDALALILRDFNSETGTIHLLDAAKQELQLAAQIGLPPGLLEVVRVVPVGKGIAGQTVAQGKPVSICNLQTDSGGVARPGAKQTGVGGALCVPMRAGGKIVGALGVGTVRPHEYTTEETKRLEEAAGILGTYTAGGDV